MPVTVKTGGKYGSAGPGREGRADRSVSDLEKAVLGWDTVGVGRCVAALGRGLTGSWGRGEDCRKTLPLPHPPRRCCLEPDPSQPLALSCLT